MKRKLNLKFIIVVTCLMSVFSFVFLWYNSPAAISNLEGNNMFSLSFNEDGYFSEIQFLKGFIKAVFQIVNN